MTRLLPFIACVALALSGCAGRADIPIASTQIDSLMTEKMIQIAYDHSMVINHRLIISPSSKYGPAIFHSTDITFEDPLAGVQSQFVAGLMKKLGLHNISMANRVEPRSEHPHSLEEHALDEVLVFQFDTRYWQVTQWSDNYHFIFGTPFWIGYTLKYSARGKLFRKGAIDLFWQAHCDPSFHFWVPGHIYLPELIADEHSVIHEKRREAEKKCAEQLLVKFFP